MFLVTVAYQWAFSLIQAMLGALSARPAAALLTTPKVLLYKAGPVPAGDSAVGDFTAVAFSGYADASLTLAGPILTSGGEWAMIGTVTFTATTASPFVVDTAIGYIVYDGATAYYGGEQFADPVPFGQAGAALSLTVVLPLASLQAAQ